MKRLIALALVGCMVATTSMVVGCNDGKTTPAKKTTGDDKGNDTQESPEKKENEKND